MSGWGNRLTGGLILGLVVLLLGVVFTLGNLKVLNADSYVRFWPAILIVIGLVRLLGSEGGGGRGFSILLIVLGSALLLGALQLVDISELFFPVLLIIVGAHFVFRAISPRRALTAAGGPGDHIRTLAVLSGIERKNSSSNFTGGEAAAVMGGCEIDLRDARITGPEAVVDTFALWGAVELRVPEDWRVTSEVFPLMGSYQDSTKRPAGEVKGHLVVRGLVIMGGVEVKN